MTKADKLREKLRATRNRMTRAEAIEIIGSPGNLSNMLRSGELTIEKIEDVSCVVLDPDYTTNRTLPIKRKKATKRAKSTKRHPRKVRTFKDIVDKHIPESRTDALARLALQNLIASAEGLAAIVRDQVEGIDNNPQLKTQLESSERAAQLARLV